MQILNKVRGTRYLELFLVCLILPAFPTYGGTCTCTGSETGRTDPETQCDHVDPGFDCHRSSYAYRFQARTEADCTALESGRLNCLDCRVDATISTINPSDCLFQCTYKESEDPSDRCRLIYTCDYDHNNYRIIDLPTDQVNEGHCRPFAAEVQWATLRVCPPHERAARLVTALWGHAPGNDTTYDCTVRCGYEGSNHRTISAQASFNLSGTRNDPFAAMRASDRPRLLRDACRTQFAAARLTPRQLTDWQLRSVRTQSPQCRLSTGATSSNDASSTDGSGPARHQ
jgi:hypothetical protein